MDLVALLAESPQVREIAAALASGRRTLARGSQGSSTSFIAAALARLSTRPVVLVVAHLDEADETLDELLAAGVAALRLPALEVLPGESGVSLDLFAERLAAVRRVGALGDRDAPVIICPVAALMQPVPGPDQLGAVATTLRVGERRDLSDLVAWLEHAGYKRLDAIEEAGDFAVRGGIVDIFPPGGGATPLDGSGAGSGEPGAAPASIGVPVRLDFFGDTIDRINEIDLDTMGSDRAVRSVELVCASLDAIMAGAADAAPKAAGSKVGKKKTGRIGVPPPQPGEALGGESGVSFLEYVPSRSIAVMHETLEVTEQARGYFERVTEGRVFGPPAVFKLLQGRFAGRAGGGFVEVNQFSGARATGDAEVELPFAALPPLPSDAGEAVKELGALARAESTLARPARVQVFCQNEGELSRFGELVDQFTPEVRATGRLDARVAYVHRGFVWSPDAAGSGGGGGELATVVVPYHELLHRFETRRRLGGRGQANSARSSRNDPRVRAGRALDTFLDFSPGEFVVHRDHGIAVFQGLMTMKPREVKRAVEVRLPTEKAAKKLERRRQREIEEDPDLGLEEYLTLEFAGGAKLHVPATKIDQVQKYVGGFKGKPQLSTLGGTRWKKQKESVQESVRDLAGEMLRIRAAREHMPGVRFPADTPWQKEFEAEFPFQETDDQLAAIAEIKKDMQSPRPMDRLLCGDVGYGKTEVAIRAAFKAVEFGKQVAVLVPTTVLAEQHERTFRSRFAGYPFRVESLSRFKTTQQVNEVLAGVRKGQVDVVIGTHRLLSKDVRFADLALVVIDEEQRFGVEHKERLLSLRLTVDVLTLSATPIPRTLHLSMLGLRDISSLTQAPLDRRAVVTEVIPYSERRIQQAIQRELARDGQVFVVHNRVYDIQSKADDIHRLVPDARIVVGHGQMPDGELEQVMLRFMRREADVLVSTTIIESGIDIPTANTMVINNADRFGLAELHQLRGRVGRYKHRAYCYLLLDPQKTTNETALKRLKAIEEFSMLGAGFKIAMRDLEIRGAGNILGPEQSGHIAAVGYEMYCQLLDRAVKELRHEPTQVASETSVELGVTGMIPKRYIPSDGRRMEAYRRVAIAQSPAELAAIERELKDAYGPDLPPATVRLLQLAELRVLASALKIRTVSVRDKDVLIRARPADAGAIYERLAGAAGSDARGPDAVQVTLLPPKSGEDLSEIYVRPPERYMEDALSLVSVLRRRLAPPPPTPAGAVA